MAMRCTKCGTYARGNAIPVKCSGCENTDLSKWERVDDPPMTSKEQRQHDRDKAFLEGRRESAEINLGFVLICLVVIPLTVAAVFVGVGLVPDYMLVALVVIVFIALGAIWYSLKTTARKPIQELPAFKHAKDNDDEVLNRMFSRFTTIEMLQEIAARMADDENGETVKQAAEIGLTLAFDQEWRGPGS